MTTTAKRCWTCGEGVFIDTDVRGRGFAYRDAREIRVSESLMLPVCLVCGEMRLSSDDVARLDAALESVYGAHRAAPPRVVTPQLGRES